MLNRKKVLAMAMAALTLSTTLYASGTTSPMPVTPLKAMEEVVLPSEATQLRDRLQGKSDELMPKWSSRIGAELGTGNPLPTLQGVMDSSGAPSPSFQTVRVVDPCDLNPGLAHCGTDKSSCEQLGGTWDNTNKKCDFGGGLGWKNTNWIPVELVIKDTSEPGRKPTDRLIRYSFHVNADDKKAYVKDFYVKVYYPYEHNRVVGELSKPENRVVDITDSLGASFSFIHTGLGTVVYLSPSRTYVTYQYSVFRSGTDDEQGNPQFLYDEILTSDYFYY